MASQIPPASSSTDSDLGVRASNRFAEWLDAAGVSLVFTTYQTNRLFFVGLTPDGRLSGFERLFDRPMGLYATPERLTMATRYQIRELVNVLPDGDEHEGYDRLYVPRQSHVTGELDAHDVHRTPDGEVVFVNTRYSCLARPSATHSFRPVWTPPFISRLVPEDRCHLNGLATDSDGRPRYVTAVSRSDVASGWRDRRANGGIVVSVDSGEIVADGLSMPHSPRLYNGELYIVNAGTGQLGTVDRDSGSFDPIAFVPGYGRGLAFHGDYALVGLSKPRRSHAFQGLTLSGRLQEKDVDAKCGLYVIELSTGRVAHWMEFNNIIEEIYDVQVLPGVRRPMALGFKTDEIARFITMETDDRPVKHLITLQDTPQTSDDGTSERGVENIAEPELPVVEEAADGRGVRTSATKTYTYKTFSATAGETVNQLAGLLPGRFRRQMASGALSPDHPLTVVLAMHDHSAIGLAAADVTTKAPHGVLHAVFVQPDHRSQGIATQLIQRIESEASDGGIRTLHTRYRSTLPSASTLERVFTNREWSSPEPIRRLYRGRRDRVTPTFREALPSLPSEGAVFPWTELRDEERRRLQARVQSEGTSIPAALNPFQLPERMDPSSSIGWRHDGRVAGWMVTHRISDDILQYTCLYVEPSVRDRRLGPALLGEAIRRYLDRTDMPRCIWMVDADKPVVQRFVERRLASVIDTHADEMHAEKTLR